MSWQDYIDTQLVGKELKEAVIAGHDGNVWAKSSNFNVTPGEIQTILSNYTSQESLASAGLRSESPQSCREAGAPAGR